MARSGDLKQHNTLKIEEVQKYMSQDPAHRGMLITRNRTGVLRGDC